MKSKLFGGGKAKQSVDNSPAGYSNSSVPSGYRAPSPRYAPPEEQTQQPNLSRNSSQRQTSGGSNVSRPPIDVAASAHAGSNIPFRPNDERLLVDNRNSYIPPPLSPNPPQEKEQKRGFRDRLGIGHSSKQSVDQNLGVGRPTVPGRSLSVKRKEPQNQQNQQSLQNLQNQQIFQNQQNPEKYYAQAPVDNRSNYSRNSSNPQLLSTQTEEDEEVPQNVYYAQQQQQQQQQQYPGPPVPLKDHSDEPTYPQQPQPPQAYYRDPRSPQRVNTDHSYHTQGSTSVELLQSPVEQQYRGVQHDAQLQQEQYQTVYQPPQDAGPGGAQYQQPADETGRYPYPPQPQAQTQQGAFLQHVRQASGGQPGQPDLHYSQPQQGRASLDRYRPSSQGQQQPAPQLQQPVSQDPLRLQPPRGSSTENPPSPLQPPLAPPYDQQQQQGALHPPPSPQPPSTADSKESDEGSMPAPPGSRGNNTIRPVDNKTMAAPREGGQQGNGTLPPTPGFQTFGSNVVPAGSQGQPYRGGQAAVQEGAERGRDTPPPRASDLTDDDAMNYHQLQKDYKELRDKYQKVKKYYFEKESQVHQLQNTLAHQRLSQSRTSLDDSEYAARFSRLEGLIAQLSFSIRKSWKSIPEFLHRGINKDALATGKQEMTAVGRAFFSQWIVQNLFDAYFHPDLELGLSRDLKEIWHNIRRFCPPFQSGEEEEALAAKMINWRLTTLEGMQDRLRGPDAPGHRQRLTEMMNEKLMADIGHYLIDPVPSDLQGGVSMILDLAVNVAMHVPLESREVIIEYYNPLYPVSAEVMKIESGIPPLANPIVVTDISPSSVGGSNAAEDTADRASLKSTGTRDSGGLADDQTAGGKDEKGRRGVFGTLMGGGGSKVVKPAPGAPVTSAAGAAKPAAAAAAAAAPGRETPKDKEERVRISTGLSVQIRGRSVLVKAPVYCL